MADQTPLNITGVLCCGNVVFDIPVWPVDQFTWNTSLWVETVTESIGGNGANTSYTLGMHGIPVRLLSTVGTDDRGDRLIAILNHAGVDTSFVTRSAEKPTPTSVAIINHAGDRMFLHRPGASRDVEPRAILFDHSQIYSHFHMANPFALPKLRPETADVMRRAHKAGLTTSMDMGWDSKGLWIEEIGPALSYTGILFCNEEEAEKLGGIDRLRELGAATIVVKKGARGCTVYQDIDSFSVPGFSVKAIDTTGAGDCFAGAYLAALAHGETHHRAALFANAVGALNVEQLGASAGVRPYNETWQWLVGQALLPAADFSPPSEEPLDPSITS